LPTTAKSLGKRSRNEDSDAESEITHDSDNSNGGSYPKKRKCSEPVDTFDGLPPATKPFKSRVYVQKTAALDLKPSKPKKVVERAEVSEKRDTGGFDIDELDSGVHESADLMDIEKQSKSESDKSESDEEKSYFLTNYYIPFI
jgi:hypothetical protein